MQQDATHPTGVATTDGEKDNSDSVIRARQRKASAALDMLIGGHSLRDVAKTLGYPTERAVLVATEQALERHLTYTDREILRAYAGRRLDALLNSVWDKATDQELDTQLGYNEQARRIVVDHRKLWGLDAPAEVILHNPTEREIDELVGEFVGIETKALPEASIFDDDPDDEDVVDVEWYEDEPNAEAG